MITFSIGDIVTNGFNKYTIKSFNKTDNLFTQGSNMTTVEYVEGGWDWIASIKLVKKVKVQLEFDFMRE